ncbi:MAG: HAD family hydrolase [Bacteroidales bacterium]|nr:HAD family hydrolase [Bacteroidales bacterium]
MNKDKLLIFDYGATLDTNGVHWYYVFKKEHEKHNPFLSDEQMRDAYVYAEQSIAKQKLINPEDNFLQTLNIKVKLQYERLFSQGVILKSMYHIEEVAEDCYLFAKENTAKVRQILETLSDKYALAIVSNFYGNLNSVLNDYGLSQLFSCVVESAVLGVSKPDKRLLLTALKQTNMRAEQTTVIGDSYKKDIVPAKQVGCSTVWLKGMGWRDNPVQTPMADKIITDILSLPENLI